MRSRSIPEGPRESGHMVRHKRRLLDKLLGQASSDAPCRRSRLQNNKNINGLADHAS